MKSNKLFFLLLVIILSLFTLTGCWNRKELGDLGIVGAVSIDESGEKLRLTYEMVTAISKDSKGDQEPVSYLQSEGQTVFDANRNATLKSANKLFWPHINMIYFSPKFAQRGLFTFIDFFNRDHEARRFPNIAVTKMENAYEILPLTGTKADIPSRYVEKLFENYSSNGKSVSIKLSDFLKAYYAEGIEPVAGLIQVAKKVDTKEESSEGGSDKESKDDKKNENLVPSIEGLAVFKEDQLIGFFNGEEARGYNFLTNELKSCIIVSPALNSEGEPVGDSEGKNGMEVITSSCDKKVEVKDDQYYATVKVEINGMLDSASGTKDVSCITSIKTIEESTSEIVKNEIGRAIQKAKEYHSDIFGFGQALHISDPKKWKQIKGSWNEEFVSLNVNVMVKTNIQRAGVENEQLSFKESR